MSITPASHPRRHRNGWTPERRARQSQAIARWKPWAASTGPRTAAGKARSRLNAARHGLRSAPAREFYRLLSVHRRFRQLMTARKNTVPLPDDDELSPENLKNWPNQLMDCFFLLEKQYFITPEKAE
jgi:hypothetical protein